MKLKNKNKGITLIALVITIIILLILAGIAISQLTENGLFDKVKLAKEKSEQAQTKENTTLADYENKIEEYIYGTRNNATTNVLWEGDTSNGTLNLTDSIYNYDILKISTSGLSCTTLVEKDGMNKIHGGSAFSYETSNGCAYWGFYISSISPDGKTLILARSGQGTYKTEWDASLNIKKIIGLKF